VAGLRTEFEFTLPKGYVADDGTLHRDGVMRLATARDEIEPLRDRSIDGPDDPYLTILVLARVITKLGTLESIGVREVEGVFAADLAFLQDLYGIINFGDQDDVEALQASVLPDPIDEAAPDDTDIAETDIAETDIAAAEIADGETETETGPAIDTEIEAEIGDSRADIAMSSSTATRRSRIEEIPRAASH
jgi:hypothetical protein